MMGNYPITRALRSGLVGADRYRFDFADVAVPNTAFKRTVRNLEFDVSELAIVTFLQAFDAGVDLVLLPVVLVSRFQHPFLMYDSRRGLLRPKDLRGKRIGVRSYCVTTVTWIRGMLQADHGIQPSDNRWVGWEEAHVAQWRDPDWVETAPPGSDMLQMLEAGELDAAVLANAPADKPHIQPVFADPVRASQAWHTRHRVIQINHMVVLKRSLVHKHPEFPAELMALLRQSRQRGLDSAEFEAHPMGLHTVRPHLEFAIDMVHKQGLTRSRPQLEDLFDGATLLE
jgi:4,5-dihydroxyphthalate decarboxylase